MVVWVGLILNIWVIFILWIGGSLPGFETIDAAGKIVADEAGRLPIFYEVRSSCLWSRHCFDDRVHDRPVG